MESLLRWSLANSTPLDSTPGSAPPPRREDLNPEIIDMILGKPDAELMKEDVAVAVDATKSEDERLAALDHLEMLIEQIDNANNLGKLKLWEPLQEILTSDSASKEIKVAVLWVIGTALQNNPSAQDVYTQLRPLPTLLTFLSSKTSTIAERSKVIYTLSGLLKQNAPALRQLTPEDWQHLRDALLDPEISVRRKTMFWFSALLVPTTPEPERRTASAPPPPPPTTSATATTTTSSATQQQQQQQPGLQLSFTPGNPDIQWYSTPAVVDTEDAPGATPDQPPLQRRWIPNNSASSSSSSNQTSRTTAVAAYEGTPAAVTIHTPDSRPQPSNEGGGEAEERPPVDPIHDNSHAANLRDASRPNTTPVMLQAVKDHGIVDLVVDSLVSPVPYGEDGEEVGEDEDYVEKVVHFLQIYATQCKASFTPAQSEKLKKWYEEQKKEAQGDAGLATKWNLGEGEVKALVSAFGA